jgi:predicted nucleic acid-binding protein
MEKSSADESAFSSTPIVLDTNIIIGALIRDSAIRRVLLEFDLDYCLPSAVKSEIGRHLDEIGTKSGMGADSIALTLNMIMMRTRMIPDELIQERWT